MERNRKWMYEMRDARNYITHEYSSGVYSFIEFAFSNPKIPSAGLIRCPCRKCKNMRTHDRLTVGKHLIKNGFVDDYEVWICHGEVNNDSRLNHGVRESSSNEENNMETFRDAVFDAFPSEIRTENTSEEPRTRDAIEQPNQEAREFINLMNDANQPLYEGSDQTVLEWCAEFLNYKTQHSISAAACDNMLKLGLQLLRPEDREKLPTGFEGLQKLMRGLGLVHATYDVCKNNDFLYYGDGAHHEKCPVCGKDRYKEKKSITGKKIAKKKLWYFPIAARLQRLFMSRKTAEHMTWHHRGQKEIDKFVHPAGGEAWKDFDRKYPEFASDPRNVRLGLCTDGFNPHSQSATPYSCWPVFLTPYNLPPDLCMKDETIFLSLIISGPQSPGMHIDVLLRPLIDELKTLWSEGVVTFDRYKEQNFTMRAAVLWTISDFPAYGMLSGWSTHGRLSCPYCMEKTKSFRLPNGKKPCWFDCHRQFLPLDHPARNDKKNFIRDRQETSWCKERISGEETYNSVQHIAAIEWAGKVQQRDPGYGINHNWAKKSIFWELPYYPYLLIRHNLDVMHIERNFFENIFRTIMDDPNKTKDNVKSRMDLPKYTKRKSLFLIPKPGKKAIKPKAAYTLSKDQRRHVSRWLKELRFPDAHVANIGRRVKDVETGKIYGMKSHDCHVFMQRLLPIAFCDFLPDDIWGALTEISNFFRALCSSEIRIADIEILQTTILETICKLETFFPPSFFDSMKHLVMHLPYEARVGGPVFYHWMYPFERKMFVLKSMVKNKARVEGSICEAYLNMEISNFCSHYFERDIDTRPKRARRNETSCIPEFNNQLSIFIPKGNTIGKASERGLSSREYKAAMYYILMNCEEVDPWICKFRAEFGVNKTDEQFEEYCIKEFVNWFRNTILAIPTDEVDERLRTLAFGGRDIVSLYRGYTCNGLKFHTEEGCKHLTTMNSGICVRARTSTEDEIIYYGMLKEVIEMSFHHSGPLQKIVLFKGTWYDPDKAITIHPKYGLIDVDPRFTLKTYDEFIFATQASQVYYASYPSSSVHRSRQGKFAVCMSRARHIINVSSLAAAQSEVNHEQEYYQDEDPPRGANLVVDFSQHNIPYLAEEDGEIVDVPEEIYTRLNLDEEYIEELYEDSEEEVGGKRFEDSDDEW